MAIVLDSVPDNLGTVPSGGNIRIDGSGVTSDFGISQYLMSLNAPRYKVPYNYKNANDAQILSSSTNYIFTTIAPTVYEDTDISWNLRVTDSQGTRESKTVTITVLAANGTLTVDAGSNIESATIGDTIQLNATAESDVGIKSYRWEQTKGALVELNDRNVSNPTFTMPNRNTATSFADDLDYLPERVIGEARFPLGLRNLVDIEYLGVGTLNGGGETSSNYAHATLGVSEDGTSMYMQSIATSSILGSIAKFDTPKFAKVTDPNDFPNGAQQQPYVTILDHPAVVGTQLDRISHMYEFNGKLIVQAYVDYGTVQDADNLLVLDPDDIAAAPVGSLQMDGKTFSNGFISPIPANLQASFGGATHITASGKRDSILSRFPIGHSLFTVNPQDILDQTIEDDRSVPTTEYMKHTWDNPLAPNSMYFTELYETEYIYTGLSSAVFAFIVPDTDIFLVLGNNGGTHSGIGYKILSEDFGTAGGGPSAYDAGDGSPYFWAYSVTDIINAANTYSPRPIAHGKMQHPFSGSTASGAFDPNTNRLFIGQKGTGQTGQFDYAPAILAYSVKAKDENSLAIVRPPALEFRLTVTNNEGHKVTDTVVVSTDIINQSSLLLSVEGMPNNLYAVEINDGISKELISTINAQFVDGESTVNIDVPVGTNIQYTIKTNTHIAGGTGVTS